MVVTRVVYVPVQTVYAPRKVKIEAWDAIQSRISPEKLDKGLKRFLQESGYDWDDESRKWYNVDDLVSDSAGPEGPIFDYASTEEKQSLVATID